MIAIYLPVADADVYINGQKARGIGDIRYVLTGLMPPGGWYQYWVKASYPEYGQQVSEYRKVEVGPGEITVADFLRQPRRNSINLPSGPLDNNELVPPTPTAGKNWP